MKFLKFTLVCLVALLPSSFALGSTILGTGAGALIGGDLTDLDDTHVELLPPSSNGFDADFFASNEAGFGGGEFAFNVFDNAIGGGGAKWCCGATGAGNSGQGTNQIVGAFNFTSIVGPIHLTGFTLTSSNDSVGRDPVDWEIQGSNDTTDGLDGAWTTIFDHASGNDWTARNQVISYSESVADGDTFLSDDGFTAFRMVTFATDGGGTSGAFFALNEIEFFGEEFVAPVVPEPASIAIWSLLGLCLAGYGYRRRRNK